MKLLVFLTFIFTIFFFLAVDTIEAYSRTRGYFRRDGAYVQPYYRSSPNSYKWDNYSSWGNSNPWTGKRGYKKWW